MLSVARLVYLITWRMCVCYTRHHSPSIECDGSTCILSFEMKDFNVGCRRFAAVCHLQLSYCKRACFNQCRPISCSWPGRADQRVRGRRRDSPDVSKPFWGRVCSTVINPIGVCSCYPWSSSLLYLVVLHRRLLLMSWTNHVTVHHIGGQNQRVMQVSFLCWKKRRTEDKETWGEMRMNSGHG